MTKPWADMIEPDQMDVVSPEGELRCRVTGYYAGGTIIVDDPKAKILPQDEMRRMLPNGLEEAFVVTDPKFFSSGGFGPHFQIKVQRRGSFEKHSGGNYQITVTGDNSRVNIHSNDWSQNFIANAPLYANVKQALSEVPADEKETLYRLLDEMQAAKSQSGFLKSYQGFISSAANHMSLIAPFIPALGELLKHLPEVM